MVTKIQLSEQELADLKELTNQTDPEAALRTAMQDYLRYARRLQLKQLSGQVQTQDNWQELEDAELEARSNSFRWLLLPFRRRHDCRQHFCFAPLYYPVI